VPDSRSPHVRHTLFNLLGIGVPLVLGLLVIPVLVRELGPARFGLLSIAWAVLEYFTLFDAGLGRATTREVADRLARGAREGLGDVVAGSLLLQLGIGMVGGVVLALTAPLLVEHALRMPAELRGEAHRSLLVLSAMLPLVLLSLAVRGLLEAAGRFGLSNLLRAPTSAATFLVPAAMALAGATLPQILAGLVVVRAVSCVAGLWLVRRAIPQVRWRWPRQWRPLRSVAAFGGWVAVSNVLTPGLLLFDRFALGAIVGLTAVGYYTGPYEASTRVLLLPAALIGTVFPAAAALAARGERAALRSLYLGALRALIFAMLGGTLAAIVLAPHLLALWLGPEIAAHGATAFRILLAAVFVNALVHVPFSVVQALGRADLTARFHLLEVAVHVPITLLLVQRWGVPGAGASWALRVALDALLVFGAAGRLLNVRLRDPLAGRWWPTLLIGAGTLALAMLAAQVAAESPRLAAAMVLAAAVGYAAAVWRLALTSAERATALAAVRTRRPRRAPREA